MEQKSLKGKTVEAFYSAWFLRSPVLVEGEVVESRTYKSDKYIDSHLIRLTYIPNNAKAVLAQHHVYEGAFVDFYDVDIKFVVREADGKKYSFAY